MQNLLYDRTAPALRLRYRRGFATMAALVLSLGVGAATAVFSVADYALASAALRVRCETVMRLADNPAGLAIPNLRASAELQERVTDAYETSYESAGDATDSLPELAGGLGARFVLALLGAGAIALLLACTRAASKVITSSRALSTIAGTTVGALSFAALTLRAFALPSIGVRAAAFALCVALLAVCFARASRSKAEPLVS